MSLFTCSQVCLCVIERTIGGLNVFQSPVPWAEQGKWPSLSIQALRDDALSVSSTETVRSMPLVVQRSLEELRYEEPATEAGRKLAWPFFWFQNSFCQSKWSKKKGKKASASLRPIVRSKKAEKKVTVSSSGVHAYRSKIYTIQTEGRGLIGDSRPGAFGPRAL